MGRLQRNRKIFLFIWDIIWCIIVIMMKEKSQ